MDQTWDELWEEAADAVARSGLWMTDVDRDLFIQKYVFEKTGCVNEDEFEALLSLDDDWLDDDNEWPDDKWEDEDE